MYTALDPKKREIRLLRLLPGGESDDITCELDIKSLDSAEEFEALSYVWGDASVTRPIIIQQETRQVTKNLDSALHYLRYSDRPRALWVDAVCIDQENISEKSIQVQLMGDIYSSASQVRVWLGPILGAQGHVITAIERLGMDPKLHWTEADKDTNLMSIFQFLKNPWWSRIWTVQEAVLAKQITYQCGDRQISDTTMNNMASSFLHHTSAGCCQLNDHLTRRHGARITVDSILGGAVDRMQAVHHFRDQARVEQLGFDKVALQFLQRNATDPRDKVYGLLGISRGVGKASVDYSLSPSQVFETAARQVLSFNGNLNLLSQCLSKSSPAHGSSQKTNTGLPSWVPDWADNKHNESGILHALRYRIPFIKAYNACGELQYVANDQDAQSTLGVSGVYFDTIKYLGGKAQEHINFGPFRSCLYEWRRMTGIDRNPSRPYVSGTTIADAFWRTLCLDIRAEAGMTRFSGDKRAGPEDMELYLKFWYRELLDSYGIPKPEYILKDPDIKMFQQHLMRTITGRRFFISNKGYIGLVPASSAVGDHICVFSGGKMPFVIRALPDNAPGLGKPGRLVGDAYVHGLMDGEAIEIVNKGIHELERFTLL